MQDPAEVAEAYLDVARRENPLPGMSDNYARARAAIKLLSDVQRGFGIRNGTSDVRVNAAKVLMCQIIASMRWRGRRKNDAAARPLLAAFQELKTRRNGRYGALMLRTPSGRARLRQT